MNEILYYSLAAFLAVIIMVAIGSCIEISEAKKEAELEYWAPLAVRAAANRFSDHDKRSEQLKREYALNFLRSKIKGVDAAEVEVLIEYEFFMLHY